MNLLCCCRNQWTLCDSWTLAVCTVIPLRVRLKILNNNSYVVFTFSSFHDSRLPRPWQQSPWNNDTKLKPLVACRAAPCCCTAWHRTVSLLVVLLYVLLFLACVPLVFQCQRHCEEVANSIDIFKNKCWIGLSHVSHRCYMSCRI